MKTRILLATVLLVSLALTFGCAKAETKSRPPKPARVKAAEKRPASGGVRYSASIRPNSQVELAFKVGGYVEGVAQVRDASGGWRYLQAGDVVTKGTVLARLRQSDYLAKVNQAGAQHAEARSALETVNAQMAEARAHRSRRAARRWPTRRRPSSAPHSTSNAPRVSTPPRA